MPAAVILCLVLGDKAEFNLRTALKIGHGDWTVLFSGPISVVLAALVVAVLIDPLFGAWRKRGASVQNGEGA